ncbi:NAD-dependent epimerase/dehydratase family protein [Iocasia frigidifontis]|uniref:UDP-glucose 4-epimerase n=1 Tax=Iocasia fonsfrigidae TaxID=2682810 RepID=A0A8A7KIP3_9FIRM|nr:SDR family oxidoreductase [Iocasia fonsfrigidae]QTL99668.1 NAD-dependent epimerase/dehydratase family protein [Iocasia fonsfrigidae]
MKVLVTGGAGFIGSNIVDCLVEQGYQTVIVDNLSQGKAENINQGAEFYQVDVSSPLINGVFKKEGITHVIHHAAQIDVQQSLRDPLFDIKNNITGTVNLLECCRKYNVKKIIYPSSAAVYGEPDYLPLDECHPLKAISPYGISKHTPEHYLRAYQELYDLDYTIFRYANVYGPRQDPKGEGGVISIFVDKMLAGERPVIFGDGEQSRDFIYVRDIVEANLKALSGAGGKLLNISSKIQVTVNELYQLINKILGSDLEPVYQKERKGDIRHSYLDNSRARAVLEWEPLYDLSSGLKETLAYYRSIS